MMDRCDFKKLQAKMGQLVYIAYILESYGTFGEPKAPTLNAQRHPNFAALNFYQLK
jgi:hypothetical protein